MNESAQKVEAWKLHLLHKEDMLAIIRRFGDHAVANAMSVLDSNNPRLIAAYLCAGGHCPEA